MTPMPGASSRAPISAGLRLDSRVCRLPPRVAINDRAMPAITARHARSRRSEEHTSELQSLMRNSYAVFCLKKKKHLSKKHYTNITTPLLQQQEITHKNYAQTI